MSERDIELESLIENLMAARRHLFSPHRQTIEDVITRLRAPSEPPERVAGRNLSCAPSENPIPPTADIGASGRGVVDPPERVSEPEPLEQRAFNVLCEVVAEDRLYTPDAPRAHIQEVLDWLYTLGFKSATNVHEWAPSSAYMEGRVSEASALREALEEISNMGCENWPDGHSLTCTCNPCIARRALSTHVGGEG